MLTAKPTSQQTAQWKKVFEENHSAMKPNRKTGAEVDRYFREKYPYRLFDSARFRKIVVFNITENDLRREKLPEGVLPNVQSYRTGNALVGIDLCTGEFHVESENTEEAETIYDDLFVYRGLDEADLKNFFLVAEYVKLSRR